jgi:hypothetical protein
MGIEGFFILMIEQLVSFIFVADAFLVRRKKLISGSGILGTNRL